MALQFGPQFLLLPWTGFAADHFNQRRLLIATQATMGGLALALGLLTVTGVVQLWHVYIFAFLFGCAAASMRRCARPSSRSWSATPICTTRSRSTRPRSTPRG